MLVALAQTIYPKAITWEKALQAGKPLTDSHLADIFESINDLSRRQITEADAKEKLKKMLVNTALSLSPSGDDLLIRRDNLRRILDFLKDKNQLQYNRVIRVLKEELEANKPLVVTKGKPPASAVQILMQKRMQVIIPNDILQDPHKDIYHNADKRVTNMYRYGVSRMHIDPAMQSALKNMNPDAPTQPIAVQRRNPMYSSVISPDSNFKAWADYWGR